MAWSRSATNFAVDASALLVLLSTLWTRILIQVIVPPPAAGEAPVVLWGWGHREWALLNFLLTMAFAVAVLVHVILHWTWVVQFVSHRLVRRGKSAGKLDSGTQTVYGVGFMIAVGTLAGLLLMVAAVMARPR